MNKKVVKKVEDGMDRQEILATTYQMRNFYRQFRDGFFDRLDVMNYIQHHQIVRWVSPGDHVLDVCCGRGLVLPLLRYHAKTLGSYTGVDIEPRNAVFLKQMVTDDRPLPSPPEEYYPFPVSFVASNVAQMSQKLPASRFDFLIYTSAIEHMHKEMGEQSLFECRKVARKGAKLFLTCPNTPETQDGFDTQYKAHVYEWKRSELLEGLHRSGWEIILEYGLVSDKKTLKEEFSRHKLDLLFSRLDQTIPPDWLLPLLSPLFPKSSKEIAFLVKAV